MSTRAKKRGLPQLGTLGAGNHYAEIQVVDEIYDKSAAGRMGIDRIGQVCVMIHSGSRGFGHQVATGQSTASLLHSVVTIQRFSLTVLPLKALRVTQPGLCGPLGKDRGLGEGSTDHEGLRNAAPKLSLIAKNVTL